MNNTLFEQFGGAYTKQSDYLLPNLILSAEKNWSHQSVGTTKIKLFKAPSQRFVLQSAHFWQTPFPPC